MEKAVEIRPGRRLKLIEGDITQIRADAIVNAANGSLAGGGGVDGAIHDVGGPSMMRELDKMRPSVGRVAAGQAVATSAGRLPAKWVFHAVGPIYRDGGKGEPEALRSCYGTCLRMADELGARTISFPSISTGAYGYPAAEAARIAVGEAVRFLREDASGVEEILLVLFGRLAYKEHERALSGVLSLEAGG